MQRLKKGSISNICKNLIVTFASLLIFLLLAEAGSRILNLDSRNTQDKYLTSQDRFFFAVPINRKDPYLFWRLKPQARFGKLSVNSKGFRGKEFSEEKKSGTFRIMALGDSCTLGVGVADDETYASVLANIVNKNAGYSRKYEVINAGVAGYSSLQGLRYLKAELIKYKPDVITVQFGFNDYLYTGGPGDKDIHESSRFAIYLDDMLSKSRLYQFLKKRLESLLSKKTTFPPNRRVDTLDFRKNLKEIISEANKSGTVILLLNLPVRPDIPLVVNAIPIPEDDKNGRVIEWLRPAVIGGKNYYVESDFDGPASVLEKSIEKYPQWSLAHYFLARIYERAGDKEKAMEEFKKAKETDIDRKVIAEYNTAIREIAGEMSIPMADLVSIFESKKDQNLFLDERHISASAHAIIAEAIYGALRTNNLIE
jgi:lysophospholipase L1-like esterase